MKITATQHLRTLDGQQVIAEVFLNGEFVKNVVEVDDEAGYAMVYQRPAERHTRRAPDDFAITRIDGAFQIRYYLRDGVEVSADALDLTYIQQRV